MNFCDNCDNLCYIKLDENQEDKLTYYCKNCNNEQLITNDNLIVLKTNFKKNNNNYNIINEYTKLDPTLPRVTNINCPNVNCKTNTEKDIKTEIIYIRYDEDNLKYLYLCPICDTTWKTNDSN